MMLPAVALAQVVKEPVAQPLVPYAGSEYFRFILHLQKLTPLKSVAEADDAPEDTLIVIHGDRQENAEALNLTGPELHKFLFSGGAILIASDRPPRARVETWDQTFGMMLTGDLLQADARDCYQELKNRPFVRPRLGAALLLQSEKSPHQIFKGVADRGLQGVATDLPSTMYLGPIRRPGLTVTKLAGYPPSTVRRDGLAFDPIDCLFAIGVRTNDDNGRMLVLADQSVFVNGMLGLSPRADRSGVDKDNGNFEFTKRAIGWLQGGGAKPRTKCLFVEDGRIIAIFAVTLPPRVAPKMPELPPDVIANILLNRANGIVDEMQDRNVPNRFIEGTFGMANILRYFLFAATFVVLMAGLRWLIRGRWKVPFAATTPAAALEPLLPRGGVLRQRQAAQYDAGNLYEATRNRVRDRFDRLGGRPDLAGGMPPVLIADDGPDARAVSFTVQRLWEVGYGRTPVTVTPADWDEINHDLEKLMRQAARGTWTFGQEVV